VIEKNTELIRFIGMILLSNIAGVPSEELKKEFVNVCKWLNLSSSIFGDPSSPDTKFFKDYLSFSKFVILAFSTHQILMR
jgi:hypothetical protein